MSFARNDYQAPAPLEGGSPSQFSETSMFEATLLRQFQIPKSKHLNFSQAKLKQSDQQRSDQQRSDQQRSDQQRSYQQRSQSESESIYDSPTDSDSDFMSIRFQVINRKNFKLRPEDAVRSLLPIVLVGNKRRACNFINYLNSSSPDYRTLLKLKRGELIPFKMLDADSFSEFSLQSLNGRNIRLLCIYSEIFDQDVEKKIRDNLMRIADEVDLQSSDDESSSDSGFIKTVSTIYLRNANSNLKITRAKHRRNMVESHLNFFKTHLKSYSELPEIGWQDIICLNSDLRAEIQAEPMSCAICTETFGYEECATYSCGHSSCLRCAGSIASVSKRCPFCRRSVNLNNISLRISYVPSLFSSIKELLDDIIPYERYGAQSVIYVQNELAIQHLYNFLIQSVEPLEDRMEILSPTINFSLLAEGSPHHYFLACSNDLISKLPNLYCIITSTDDEHCKNLMLDFKSYGRNYGKANQELIVLNAE